MKIAPLVVAALLAAPQTIFRSGVDAVRVDVLVTRGSQPIGGLKAADFELRDSGVPQAIDVLALEDVPLNLLLVIDTSTSVRGEPLRHLKDAARAAIGSLRSEDRVSLISFSHAVRRVSAFTADRADMLRRIEAVTADGSTALADALFAALALRTKVDGRVLVVVFSDGIDTSSWLDPVAVIDAARRSDVVIDAVGLAAVTDRVTLRRMQAEGAVTVQQVREWFLAEPTLFRHEFLPALADETGGDIVTVRRTSELSEAFVKIVKAFKSRYVLTYSPKNVDAPGWHPIDVQLKTVKGDVRARRGYMR